MVEHVRASIRQASPLIAARVPLCKRWRLVQLATAHRTCPRTPGGCFVSLLFLFERVCACRVTPWFFGSIPLFLSKKKKKEKEAMAETIAAPEALALGESLPVGDPHVRAPSRPFRLPIFDPNEKPGR